MKAEKAKELLILLKKIYAGEEAPEKFAEFTGMHETYLEELWPTDQTKLVGDWISRHIDVKLLLDTETIKEFSLKLSKEFQELLFYANLPNHETIKYKIRDLQALDDASSSLIESAWDT